MRASTAAGFASRCFATALVLCAGGAVAGCHREAPHRIDPEPAVLAPVPAPRGLLLEGALRRPAEVWQRLRTLVGDRALLLPASYSLAVTTVIGASPLVAGLVDDSTPVALAVVDAGDAGPGLVAGIRLTSGREFVAALSSGSNAPFRAKEDTEHGITVMSSSGGSSLWFGVSGDYLVVATTAQNLRAAGAYVARTIAPSVGAGESLTLVARKAALSGPIAEWLAASFSDLRRNLEVADVTNRARHGGRNPDFGDPAPVMAALSNWFDDVLALTKSASELRISGALLEPLLRAKVEVSPEGVGALHELIADLPVGDANALLSVPTWAQAAVLVHRHPEGAGVPGVAARLEAVLGSRLRPPDRTVLSRFAQDMDRGIGGAAVIGLFGIEVGAGAFAFCPNGDGDALRRAAGDLVGVSKVTALSGPLEARLGRVSVEPVRRTVAGIGNVSGAHVKTGSGLSGAEPLSFDVVAASIPGTRVAAVLAPANADERLRDLLMEPSGAVSGADAAVASEVVRAGDHVAAGAVFRVQGKTGTQGYCAATLGTSRESLWAEIGFGEATLRALGVAGRP